MFRARKCGIFALWIGEVVAQLGFNSGMLTLSSLTELVDISGTICRVCRLLLSLYQVCFSGCSLVCIVELVAVEFVVHSNC